jgi:acyl carrier protein
MNPSAVERDVRRFLDENFPLSAGGAALDGAQSLIEAGVIDSTGVLEVIEFIEGQYGIAIPDQDVLPENLDSIDAIARYVTGRLNGSEHSDASG